MTVDEAVALAGRRVAPIDHDNARLVDPKSLIVRTRAGVTREIFPAPPTAVLLPDDQVAVGRDFVRK